MTMTKTQAIAAAQKACGKPIRRGHTDWVMYVPHCTTKPEGPDTEVRATSYQQAMTKRTGYVAEIALHHMGKWSMEAACQIDYATHDPYGARGVDALIAIGLTA